MVMIRIPAASLTVRVLKYKHGPCLKIPKFIFKMNEGSPHRSQSEYTSNDGESSSRVALRSFYSVKEMESYMDILSRKEWSYTEKKVLVLYTGGSIGMGKNDRGALEPLPDELEKRLRRYPHVHDEDFAKKNCPNSPFLVLPVYKETGCIIYMIHEYSPLVDSANITGEIWSTISKDIRELYKFFDGFVVLTGTDTLSYTASALSFMLEDLGKPVVVTGSQIPIFEIRSDGRHNFVGAIIMAGLYKIPEVTVFFNHKLFRGNRTQKVSSNNLYAFDSPNMLPLAVEEISINVNHNLIIPTTKSKKFKVSVNLCPHIGLIYIFPFITTETIKASLAPPTKGVVLLTYGTGNIPNNRKEILQLLKEATERGIIIINITQCIHGVVEALYESGAVLEDAGVIPGYDMTVEAALTKLSYVLGKDWDIEVIRKAMMSNIRGEMTKPEDQQNNNFL